MIPSTPMKRVSRPTRMAFSAMSTKAEASTSGTGSSAIVSSAPTTPPRAWLTAWWLWSLPWTKSLNFTSTAIWVAIPAC